MNKKITDEATIENGFSEVVRLIGWLQYVPEYKFTPAERFKLIAISAKFAKIAQPLARKYID